MTQSSDSIDREIAHSGLQTFLCSNFVLGARTPDGVRDSKADRMMHLETTDLFFKGIRKDFDDRSLDFLCDLLCSNLGQYLDLPVIPQVPIDHPEHGLGLVSPYLDGEKGIVAGGKLANAEKVPQLCVFEEWVMNTDDKAEHFRTVEQNGEQRVFAFDHGHTLHQANSFDPDSEGGSRIHQSVGKNPYDCEMPEEVEAGVELIEGVKDDDVHRIVKRSIDQIHRTASDDPDIQALIEDADTHTTTIGTLLRERRLHIDQIVESKFQ